MDQEKSYHGQPQQGYAPPPQGYAAPPQGYQPGYQPAYDSGKNYDVARARDQRGINVLVAIFCPPAAVYLVRGCGGQVWINLLLCFLTFGIGGLIHAIIIATKD